MATTIEPKELDIQEQLARIRRMAAESDKLYEERLKMEHERLKIERERLKIEAETKVISPNMIFQAMLATAALLGAGAAIAKLFFP